jgi:hypothetical protein
MRKFLVALTCTHLDSLSNAYSLSTVKVKKLGSLGRRAGGVSSMQCVTNVASNSVVGTRTIRSSKKMANQAQLQ